MATSANSQSPRIDTEGCPLNAQSSIRVSVFASPRAKDEKDLQNKINFDSERSSMQHTAVRVLSTLMPKKMRVKLLKKSAPLQKSIDNATIASKFHPVVCPA